MREMLFVLGLVIALPAVAAEVHVINGDTIRIDGTTVRLLGIDAPEAGQRCRRPGGGTWPCGQDAIDAIQQKVTGARVTCDSRGLDDSGRTLGVCRIGSVDLNRFMVEQGLAWAIRLPSGDYAGAEDSAQARHFGVWRHPTQPPWEYRQGRWAIALQKAPDGCPIKGNINRKGERIYHAPWSPWYVTIAVSAERGERWFCDEGEAIAAGWRAPYWGR